MTDTNKNFDFNKLINEVNSVIPEVLSDISGTISNEAKEDLKWFLYTNLLEKTIALYSSGATKTQVTESLLETITAFEDGFKWEGFAESYAMYDQMIWILSLGILCGISDENFKRIVTILKRDNAADLLIQRLVNYRLPGAITHYSTDYIQKSPYASLDSVVSGQDKDAGTIKAYLDKKWYQGHKDAPWHDAHKNTNVNVFFGYWAWETAALAKIFGINDSALEHQQYYPYRAVHW